MKEKDLFKKVIKGKTSRLAKGLRAYDRRTFSGRLKRVEHLKQIIPHGSYLMDFESHRVFSEAKNSFISGDFVAVILLANAFIEHWLQAHLENKGFLSESKKGLQQILNFMKKNQMLHGYLAEKVNDLRLLRNPFAHLKSFDYPYRITNKAFFQNKLPHEILEKEAQKAIELIKYRLQGFKSKRRA